MSREWQGSGIMAEFAKIAAESGLITSDLMPEGREDFVGNPSKTKPVEGATRSEPTEDYNKRDNDEGKKLIEKAHPQDAQMAAAMGKGGLVENQIQQQEKGIEIATKMPNGAQHGVHASVVTNLLKLANELDESGKHKEAVLVDKTVREVLSLPFDNGHLQKEAAWFVYPLIAGALALFGGGATGYFSSMRDGIEEDASDLLEELQSIAGKSASARKAAAILSPFVIQLKGINVQSAKGKTKLKEILDKLGPVTGKLKMLIDGIELETGEERWHKTLLRTVTFGLTDTGAIGTIRAAYSDFYESYMNARKNLSSIETAGKKVVRETSGGILKLQKLLFERGFKGKIWDGKITGVADQNTLKAALELEKMLSLALSKQGIKSNLKGKIVSNGKLVANMMEVLELIRLIES